MPFAVEALGKDLAEQDILVLSFTGACAAKPGTRGHIPTGRGACAAVCQVVRAGFGLAPLTLFTVASPLGDLCTHNEVAYMALITGVRRLLCEMPKIGMPFGMSVVLESDNKTVCQHLAEVCPASNSLTYGPAGGMEQCYKCVAKELLLQLAGRPIRVEHKSSLGLAIDDSSMAIGVQSGVAISKAQAALQPP